MFEIVASSEFRKSKPVLNFVTRTSLLVPCLRQQAGSYNVRPNKNTNSVNTTLAPNASPV